MDLTELVEQMSDEERFVFENENASHYFNYIKKSDTYMSILAKLDGEGKLETCEWEYLFQKLFVVSCKAMMEEMKPSFVDSIIYLFSRFGMMIGSKDSRLYNECFKMVEYITSMKKGKDINKDLFYGLEVVGSSKEKDDLDILLQQHHEATVFRDNFEAFMKAYENSNDGVVSINERLCINSYNQAYEREKKLVLQYENVI